MLLATKKMGEGQELKARILPPYVSSVQPGKLGSSRPISDGASSVGQALAAGEGEGFPTARPQIQAKPDDKELGCPPCHHLKIESAT